MEDGDIAEIEIVVEAVDIVNAILDSTSAVSHTVDAPIVVALTDTPPAH